MCFPPQRQVSEGKDGTKVRAIGSRTPVFRESWLNRSRWENIESLPQNSPCPPQSAVVAGLRTEPVRNSPDILVPTTSPRGPTEDQKSLYSHNSQMPLFAYVFFLGFLAGMPTWRCAKTYLAFNTIHQQLPETHSPWGLVSCPKHLLTLLNNGDYLTHGGYWKRGEADCHCCAEEKLSQVFLWVPGRKD